MNVVCLKPSSMFRMDSEAGASRASDQSYSWVCGGGEGTCLLVAE